MPSSTGQLDASLPEVLAARARAASDTRLALDVVGGVAAAAAFAAWQPRYWLALCCAAVCFAAYGAWGIADRELSERPAGRNAALSTFLRVARVMAAGSGVLAALMLLFLVLGRALGTWIS